MANTTPMRQVPGAFLNTPAPANDHMRRDLFGSGAAANTRRGPLGTSPPRNAPAMNGYINPVAPGNVGAPATQAAPQPALENPLDPVQKASRFVNELLQLDDSFPDLDSVCRPGASSDYDLAIVDPAWAPFHRPTIYPIPERVFQQFEQGQLATKMGLFMEVNLAYVFVDNALFLWDYTSPDPELFGVETFQHAITAVALVPPKPGVFIGTIKHILVVSTATEVILLGLSQEPPPAAPQIYSTRLSVYMGSLDVSYIVGSTDGRIFFGGQNDTDVHELYYQQEEKWFSSRCGTINHTRPGLSSALPSLSRPAAIPSLPSIPLPSIPRPWALWTDKTNEALADMVIDDSRKLLYTLSTTSTIRIFHMEAPGKLVKCIEKKKDSCLQEISHMISKSQLLTSRMNIVSICPISSKEASKLHLMVLTDTGCRIFLSATSSSYYMGGSSASGAPQSMQVQFVKFPPKAEPNAPRHIGMDGTEFVDVNSASLYVSRFGQRFAPGYFFDFVSKEDRPDTDHVFVSAPETGRIRLAGTTPGQPLRYHEHANWIDLGEDLRVLAVGSVTKPFSAADQPVGFGNELAVQFDQQPCEFAIMTNRGIHILRRQRMVDIFATAIRKAAGDEGITEEVRRFIHLYGRQETISTALAVACGQGNDLRNGAPRVIDQVTQDRARSAFVDFGGQPTVSDTDGQQVGADSVKLSYRYHAVGAYLSRLVRRLWKARVIIQGVNGTGAVVVNSTIDISKLNSVQENLDRLRKFLTDNQNLIRGLSGPSDLANVRSRQEEIAIQAEHQGMHGLQRLMEGIAEGISFVLMLFDERVSDIFVRLDAHNQNELRSLTYEQLFAHGNGRSLAKVLVKAIVNRNIESGANVETVTEALRRRCGSFCSHDDVYIFKAQEQLKKASEQLANPSVLRQLLGESLNLFERVAKNLTLANLQGAIQQYLELQYYAGAIQLCLRVAEQKDPGRRAAAWVRDGRPANDPREAAFEERRRCYDLIHEVLTRLDTAAAGEPEMIDGRLSLAATKRLEAYNVVNNSDDEVFHFDLYEWYLSQNFTDRILAIESDYVIAFLQRLAATEPAHADLLCRFYTLRSKFYDAADVQAELAKNTEIGITLKDRITLLSQAKGNASVPTVGISRQQQQLLAHEITVLLEIAHIQDDLLERLKADPRIPAERKGEVEERLDGPVLGLTELFNGYADQAQYYDISLLIYHAADHHAPRLIADTWQSLIESAHEEVLERLQEWEEAGRPANDAHIMQPPLPYEHVMNKVQEIAHRTSLNDHVFPIDTILTLLCKYAVNHTQDESIGADPSWPVVLFLNLGVAHATVTRVLEPILDGQEAPFTGRRRKIVVRWIMEVVDRWVVEVQRQGGSGLMGPWVRDLLARCHDALAEIQQLEVRRGQDAAAETAMMDVGLRELETRVERVMTGRGPNNFFYA